MHRDRNGSKPNANKQISQCPRFWQDVRAWLLSCKSLGDSRRIKCNAGRPRSSAKAADKEKFRENLRQGTNTFGRPEKMCVMFCAQALVFYCKCYNIWVS